MYDDIPDLAGCVTPRIATTDGTHLRIVMWQSRERRWPNGSDNLMGTAYASPTNVRDTSSRRMYMPEQIDTPHVHTVAEIVAKPELHGFVWFIGKVEKDGMVLDNVPLVKHTDVELLRKTFGDRMVLESMDGTSRHVSNQRVVRDAKWANRAIKVDDLKTLVVENMLGQKAGRRRQVVIEKVNVFTALDGKEYATATEAQAASLAWFIDQQPSKEVPQE